MNRILCSVCFVFAFVLAVSCGTSIEPEYAVATVIALEREADDLEREKNTALREHERAWDDVERGPQSTAAAMMLEAKVYANSNPRRAAQLEEEAQAYLTLHPLYIRATRQTALYHEVREEHSEAQDTFREALEGIESDGLMEMFQEAKRTPYWSPEKALKARSE